jgi:hypothetical protein
MIVAGASSLVLTLPSASSYAGKAPLVIKNGAFTGTTINRAGSDTIDGTTSYSLVAQYASISLATDGISAWYVV